MKSTSFAIAEHALPNLPFSPIPMQAGQPASVAELVDLLFAGLGERPMWNRFLDRLRDELGGTAAAFLIAAGHRGIDKPAILAPADIEAPKSEWADATAPFATLADHPLLHVMPFDEPVVFPLSKFDSAAAGNVEAGGHCIILRLRLDVESSAWLVVIGSPERALRTESGAVLNALAPFLQRIVGNYLTIADQERRRRVAEYVLDSSGTGVMLVDTTGTALMVNAAAQQIVAQSNVLSLRGGQLHALRAADDHVLQAHIRQQADQQSSIPQPECYAALALLRDDHPLPVTVIIRPGPPYGPVSAPVHRTATVVVRDPARKLRLAGPDLERLFQLTPAEARLACLLADGLSTEEAAFELGVSRNTIRSQLQAVYAKTGTNRQGDLVRMLLSSVATLAQGAALPVPRSPSEQ